MKVLFLSLYLQLGNRGMKVEQNASPPSTDKTEFLQVEDQIQISSVSKDDSGHHSRTRRRRLHYRNALGLL